MEPSGPAWQPDTTTPSAARVYDYLNGGHASYAADRELAEDLLGHHPSIRHLARVNRRFTLAAARWAAVRGIRQFLDLGCGYPCEPSLHDAAREADPSACVVYVDRDATVLSRVEATCWTGAGLAVMQADARDPAAVLAAVPGTRIIDLDQPVCAVLGATLGTMPADVARSAVAGYMAGLVPGSMAVISCLSYSDAALGAQMTAAYSAAGTWVNHSRADVESFFAGLQVEGQVGDVRPWAWPDLQEQVPGAAVLGGVGVKS